MEKTPRPGDLYRHFPDRIYQVVTIALHAQTNEQLVVYQEMQENYRILAMPLSAFISSMDRGKDPRTQSPADSGRMLRRCDAESTVMETDDLKRRRRQIEERKQRREQFRRQEKHESASEELRANPSLLKFLEADTYEERFCVLNEIRDDITDRLIDDIAVVLDVVIPEGPLDDRYLQLRNIILTRQKYEISRFNR